MGLFRRGCFFIVLVGATAFGCSLSSSYSSTDNGTSPVSEASVDGETAPPSGGGGKDSDAGATATPPDPDADTVPPTSVFCNQPDAGGALLACDDFDQSTTLIPMWGHYDQGAGALAIDNTASFSAPNSVLTQVPAHATNYMVHSIGLQTGVGNGVFALDLETYLTADLASSGTDVTTDYACIVEISTDQKPYVSLCFGKSELDAYIMSFNNNANPALQKVSLGNPSLVNAWHHISIAWTFSSAGSLSVTLDGKVIGTSQTMKTVPSSGTAIQYVYPNVGLETDGQWGDTSVRLDNVRVTQP